jgi:hypothetical protein
VPGALLIDAFWIPEKGKREEESVIVVAVGAVG